MNELNLTALVLVFLQHAMTDVGYATKYGGVNVRSRVGPAGHEVAGITIHSHEPGRARWAINNSPDPAGSRLRTAEGMIWIYLDTEGNLTGADGELPEGLTSDELGAYMIDVLVEAVDRIDVEE